MKIVKRGIDNFIKNTKNYIQRVKTEHLIREYFKNNVLYGQSFVFSTPST